MITLTKNGNAIVFTFEDNAHYLFDGTIEVPVNSLTLITDNSQMATFKKSASNDIFISATYAELGMSKSELESWFKENACGSTGGGGVTSGEVETMIETSLEDYYDIDEVDAALSGKADTSAVTEAISSAVSGKVNTSAFNTYSAATDSRIAEDEEVTAAALNDLQENKADTSAVTAVANDVSTLSGAVEDAGAYYINFATIDRMRDEDWNGIVAAIDDHRPIYAGFSMSDGAMLYYGVEYMNKNSGNTEIVMVVSDNSAYYFYTFTKNGSNDYSLNYTTKPYVTDAEKTAWNAKQDALSAGTGIEISGNVISATGGGATYSAGTNISIDSANTINCTLPLSATGTNNKSVIGGRNCSATNNYSFVYGDGNKHTGGSCGVVFGSSCIVENSYTFAGGQFSNSKKEGSFTYGQHVIANNKYEHSVGKYNNSVSSSTTFGDSGNTLFSVGNGTAENARHNAFEIRQNGDIYIALNGQDVKLQDQLGGGSSYTAGDGIDITNDVISVTGKVETSAITSAITSASTNAEVAGAKAVYDAIQAGGGGGTTYSAGTNISIDTANTINCTLPIETISNSYGTRQIYIGDNIHKNNNYGAIVIANKDDSSTGETRVEFAEGAISIGSTNKVFRNGIAIGKNATAGAQNVWGCIAIGLNVAATGTTKMNLNNQIKVDTNNQVYIKDKTNTTDVCIQDAIAALGGLKLVKLTQQEYDALATKDANTLYIISNVVS